MLVWTNVRLSWSLKRNFEAPRGLFCIEHHFWESRWLHPYYMTCPAKTMADDVSFNAGHEDSDNGCIAKVTVKILCFPYYLD